MRRSVTEMVTHLVECAIPATSGQVAAFEREFGLSLPDGYKRFLMTTNGGRPVPDALRVPEWPGEGTCIHYFFGLHQDEHNNLASWTTELTDRLRKGCIPVGVDMGGNFLVLATRGGRRGSIYYWDASPDFDLSAQGRTLFLVAESIDELVANLTDSRA